MEGNDGGHFEAARDFPDCVVLGNLEDIEDAFGTALGGIEGEPVRENGEDEGMENAVPIGIV